MKTLRTIVLILIAAALLLAVIVVLYAQITLTPLKVRQTFVAEIAQYLQREISFGSVQISLFDGIRLKDVVLHKSFPWEEDDVLMCPDVTVKIRLLPLLLNRLFIKGIVLYSPQVRFYQRDLGQYISLSGQLSKRNVVTLIQEHFPVQRHLASRSCRGSQRHGYREKHCPGVSSAGYCCARPCADADQRCVPVIFISL